MITIRYPAVAGSFYDNDPKRLRAVLEECFVHPLGPGRQPAVAEAGPRRLLGLVCPHAGFVYSGPAAAWSYAALAEDGRPQTIVLLGTNHRLSGAPVALSAVTHWETPLGRLPVDRELARVLHDSDELFQIDDLAHEYEHSIEVQLPWLQLLYGEISICPISLGQLRVKTVDTLAENLAQALAGRDAVIIASSDFSHHVPQDFAAQQDRAVLEKICAIEPEEMLKVVDERRVTMCGAAPVAAMLATSLLLGASQARQLTYYSSGDISGNRQEVVGYSAVVVEK